MLTSDSDGEKGDVPKVNRLEKVMFGDQNFDRESIVTEEIELY